MKMKEMGLDGGGGERPMERLRWKDFLDCILKAIFTTSVPFRKTVAINKYYFILMVNLRWQISTYNLTVLQSFKCLRK